MSHLVVTLFFAAVLLGAVLALHAVLKRHWIEIATGLQAGEPVRTYAEARFTVTLRPVAAAGSEARLSPAAA